MLLYTISSVKCDGYNASVGKKNVFLVYSIVFTMFCVMRAIPLLNHNQPKSDLTDYSQGLVWPSVIQAQPRP